MKLLLVSVLLMPAILHAKVIFSCEGTFKAMAPGETVHLKLTQKTTKEFSMEKDGKPVLPTSPSEIILNQNPDLIGLDNYLKCGSYDSSCQDKAAKGKDDGFSDFANIISMAKVMKAAMPDVKGSNTLIDLKISDIKSGKSYVTVDKNKPSKFGNMGVYEYYGKSNKLLGRYIYAMEVLDCKDKATPSKTAATNNTVNTSGAPSGAVSPAGVSQ